MKLSSITVYASGSTISQEHVYDSGMQVGCVLLKEEQWLVIPLSRGLSRLW